VFITALPTIATMIGANRTLRGVAVTNPVGDPELDPGDEADMRRHMIERALEMLGSEVEPRTVWEVQE
jgi:glycine reductase